MNKRIIAVLLTLCLALTMLPIFASAEEDTPATSGTWGENIVWEFHEDTSTLVITGEGPIPDCSAGVSAQPWGDFSLQIKSIVMEPGTTGTGITSIGMNAFGGMQNLETAELSQDLTSIGEYAFYGSGLKTVTLPASLTTIGKQAFSNTGLTSITIPGSVKTVGQMAFYLSGQLTSVTLEEGVEVIDSAAFQSCMGLCSVTLPDSLTTIKDSAFESSPLTEIVIPSGVDMLESRAFAAYEDNPTLEKITFTGDAPSIATDCFKNVTAIAYYPTNNTAWTEAVIQNYVDTLEGTITWVPYESEHTHSYTSVVTAPTCTEKGYTTYTCSVCEDTYTDDEVDALGHDYEDGVCTVCGVKESSVSRLSGANRYSTAFNAANAMKEVLGVETFDNIVVAYGRNFADALAGSYLATELDAPILLTEDSAHRNVTNYIKENLSANGKVYILGGENSISASFSDGLSAAGISWERLSGSNRYLTNLAILAEAGLNGKTILVCDGNNFADSLSASAANLPILLVGSNLSPDQKDYLSKLTGCSFRIIGGPNSVSESIAEALKAYGTVDRISGSTREETSAKVAEIFCPDPDTVTLAYSRNFPDGLCGGPLAYQLGAPLLLVNSGAENFAADYVAENDITSGIILGGTNSVPDKVANTIFAK